ncbi:MAG: hypothetical protein A2Y38_07640 [Spirochaetes bacterium GWB1_59_5]|nr:MAG: hypothetical protein A2Y38_07640 [Spirochaetes bacterium GWB1_59_5]
MTQEELRVEILKRAIVRNGCWGWKGSRDAKGYARVQLSGTGTRIASRVSWIAHNGEVPAGLVVCHRCDNPGCTNPAHLFLGTQSDNMTDCAQKGRHASVAHPERVPRGSKHWKARLTEEQVLEIAAALRAGVTQQALADRFGIARSTVGHISQGRNWVWLIGLSG